MRKLGLFFGIIGFFGALTAHASEFPGHIPRLTEASLNRIEYSGMARVLKFSVLKDSAGNFTRLYFQDPGVFSFHHQFLKNLPEFQGKSQAEIEAITFRSSPNRQGLLGLLYIARPQGDSGAGPPETHFYLMMQEAPSAALAAQVSKLLVASSDPEYMVFYPGLNRFRPTSEQEKEVLANAAEFKAAGIELTLEKQATKVAYNDGWGVGKVVVARKNALPELAATAQLTTDTILVTEEELRDLPPVAGVISAVPLTAGSHLVLLAQMYGIPLVYQKDALAHWEREAGKILLLSSSMNTPNSFSHKVGLTDEEFQTLKAARSRARLEFKFDPTVKEIAEVGALPPEAVGAYGGKATKFALLRRAIPANTRAKAVGIPLHYYFQFLETATAASGLKLKDYLQAELASLGANPSYAHVEERLKKVRAEIKGTRVPPAIVAAIVTRLREEFPAVDTTTPVRLKLRSSSNVEDGAEFNGAGLYESEGACITNCTDYTDLERALNKVWRSLYTARGYWARRQFNVEEARVGMGILAHEPFKGEIFNGVARFAAAAEKKFAAEIITQQGEEESVTNATGAASAEVVRVSDENREPLVLRAYKNQPSARLLMEKKFYLELVELMRKLHQHWSDREQSEIEVEWKLMPDAAAGEKLYVKQVRQIPKPKTLALADGSRFFFVTGDTLRVKGKTYAYGGSLANAIPLNELVLGLAPFTEQEFRAGKLKFTNGQAVIAGTQVPVTVGKFRFEKEAHNTLYGMVSIASSLFKQIDIDIAVRLPENPLPLSTHSPEANLRYTWKSPVPNEGFIEFADPENFLADVTVEPMPVNKHDVVVRKCPKTGLVLEGKEQYNAYASPFHHVYLKATVKGLLAKNIVVENPELISHYFMDHVGNHRLMVDLFADPRLTAAEKKTLEATFGRFLYFAGYHDSDKPGMLLKGSIKGYGANYKEKHLRCWDPADESNK